MPNVNSALGSEVVAVGGVVDPDANGAGTVDSDYIDMSKFETAMGIGLAGAMGTNGTLTFSIIQATDSSGTSAKAITGKAATALTQASPNDSDKQVVINVRASELDIANGFDHVAIRMVTATATSDSAAIILGLNPAHGPASDNDLASVAEIV